MVNYGTVKAPMAYYLMEKFGMSLWLEHVHAERKYEEMSKRSLSDWIDTFPWEFDTTTNEEWEKIFVRFGGGYINIHVTRFNVYHRKAEVDRLPYYYGLETFFF